MEKSSGIAGNVLGRSLVVTHFIKRACQSRWIALPFITQEQEGSSPLFYEGFETVRPIDELVILRAEQEGSIVRLSSAFPIREDQCLWMTGLGEVWLASYEDPLNDQTKTLVTQSAAR